MHKNGIVLFTVLIRIHPSADPMKSKSKGKNRHGNGNESQYEKTVFHRKENDDINNPSELIVPRLLIQ